MGPLLAWWLLLWSYRTRYGRVDLALAVECLYLYARILPIRLCDSTLTLVVPSGPLMVADKHNWSREVTYGHLDFIWSQEILQGCLGDRSSPSWTAGRSQGFMRGAMGDRRVPPGDLGDRRVPPGLLCGRPLCSVVAPYAVWSPLLQSGRPLCYFFA